MDAASFSSTDKAGLMALVQSKDSDDDAEFGAPEGATYTDHSGGIADFLEDMKEKAENKLADARKDEATAKHNFAMLKQSLKDQMAADSHDMDHAKADKSEAEQTKGSAEGDLS